ncbi:hypothetical protein niasHS_013463 [Heterodera schachtii]|uniref:Uncharacterized protein n=1 Tax=Heterodera schachtii TaxID=97005 RepID=A0ABD2ICS7_HETSC
MLFVSFFVLALLFPLGDSVRSVVVPPPLSITILIDRFDPIASVFVQHLNVSLLFFRDHYKIDDEMIRLDTFHVDRKSLTLHANGTLDFGKSAIYSKKMNSLRENSAFLISLAQSAEAKEFVRWFAANSSVAAIQAELSSWNGVPPKGHLPMPFDHSVDNFLHLVPAFVVFDNILYQLIRHLNISEFIVLYDKHFDEKVEYEWRKLFSAASKKAVLFEPMFTKMSDATEHVKQLDVGSKSVKNIFIVASTKNAELYMQAAILQFEARHFPNFIVFTKDTLGLKCEDCVSASLFWVRIMPNGRVATLRNFNEFLRQEEMEMDYKVPVPTFSETQVSFCLDIINITTRYLLMTNDLLVKKAKKLPKNFWNERNSTKEKTLTKMISNPREEFEFGRYKHNHGKEFYQAMIGMILKVERRIEEPDVDYYKYVANWTLEKGIWPLYGNLNVDVQHLNHYRIVTIIHEPYIQLVSENATQSSGIEKPRPCASTKPVFLNTGQRVEGYCIDLLTMLTESLNFTFELYLVEDGLFGSFDENGNWDGMIGDLVLGKAELALGPISVLAERENDIDFTVPFYDLVGLGILMKRSDVEYSMFKFLKVLEWPVWMCILGAYLFTSTLLWVFDRFSPYSYRNNSERYAEDEEKRNFTFKECLWFCMTSLTPQGGGEAPKNVSGRLVAATWWLFGFIIIASYTANLAAFLTVSRMEQTINELDDLAKQYKIEYAPLKGGSTETYFRRMAEIEEDFYNIWKNMSLSESAETSSRAKLAVWDYPISDKFTNMWRFMQESKLPLSVEEAIDRVLNSEKEFAFIADAMEIKYAILTNCQLQQIGTEFSRKPYAIAVQTGHVLKEPLSQAILRLQNERKLETCKERWWHQNERRKDCPNLEDDSSGISIRNIGGVFIVILAGIGISMTMLLIEYIYYSRKFKSSSAAAEENEKGKKLSDENGQQNGSDLGVIRKMGKRELETDNVQHRRPAEHRHSASIFNNPAFNVD